MVVHDLGKCQGRTVGGFRDPHRARCGSGFSGLVPAGLAKVAMMDREVAVALF